MIRKKLVKLFRDPDLFFEDYFAKRRGRTKLRKWKGGAKSTKRVKTRTTAKVVPTATDRIEADGDEEIRANTVLYESFDGKRLGCNPYAIFLELQRDSRFCDFEHVWILKEPGSVHEHDRAFPRTKFVKQNSLQHHFYLRTARYLINNNTFPPYFSKQPGQIYINTQHGVPIKTMGKDIKGRFGSGANVTRNFLHTDFLVMPNSWTSAVMLKAHDVSELFPGQVIEAGYPRNDLVIQGEKSSSGLREKLGVPEGKQVLLYAPTYRGDFRKSHDNGEVVSSLLARIREELGELFFVIHKAHHVEKGEGECASKVIDEVDTNVLLGIVDVLITDYSSLVFDFLPRRNPIIYYAYDLEAYSTDRGLYLDIQTLPGEVCLNEAEVMVQLANLQGFVADRTSCYDAAVEKYCPGHDGSASRQVVDRIFGSADQSGSWGRACGSGKKKILVYAGGFMNNGVTTSAVGLINNLSATEYDVYVAFNKDATRENANRFRTRLREDIKVIFYLKSGRRADKKSHVHAQKEARRLFGDAKFDVVVDASGYGKVWPGMLSQLPAKLRCIYLHNCMKSERELRPQLADYDYLFELYENGFDRLINVSQSSYEANAAYLPNVAGKMVVFDNLLDIDRIQSMANEPEIDSRYTNFINVGRYDFQKGQDRLIEAFSEVNQAWPETRLYLVGHGKAESQLRKTVVRLGLEDNVFVTGMRENPFRLIRQCDCFVMSSHYEGQGLVLLEAMLLGVPCVSTDIPGPRSILEADLLYENSTRGLTVAMIDYLAGRVRKQEFDALKYNRNALIAMDDALAISDDVGTREV